MVDKIMKRIFTAIDISAETRNKVADYIENLRGEFSNLRVGWDKAEKLHLTLKFLGDLDDKQLANLIEAVKETAKQISDFNLRIADTGVFPSKRNARILWLGVEDETGSLRKLNSILETKCEAKGFVKESRIFKPHLTIGRLREPQKSNFLIERHLQNDFQSAEFEVSDLVIYESRLQKTGSVYSVVSKLRLSENSSNEIR